jgi:hypothetical protein
MHSSTPGNTLPAPPHPRPGDTIAAMSSPRVRQRFQPIRLLAPCLFLVLATALHAQNGTQPGNQIGAPAETPADTTGPNDGPIQKSSDFSRPHDIDNATILRMQAAGLSDDILIQTVTLQPGQYSTNPDDLIALKKAGLSDRVIAAMLQHNAANSGLLQHPIPIASGKLTAQAAGLDEIGVYFRSKTGEWIPLHTERVLFKSGGAAKSILTHGIISKDMNGHVDGPHSSLVLPTGVEILIYTPVGTSAEEYDFIRFREHPDNREFRTLTGGVFHSESGAERDEVVFHPVRVGPQLYTFTVPVDIIKGEYGILPPGSANTQGLAGTGKIFTFSIPE